MKRKRMLVGSCIALMLMTSAGLAEDAKPPADDVNTLRAEIEKLQARIKTLEQACPAPSASGHEPTPAAGGGARYLSKRRWDQLEDGLEMGEVRALLGSPHTSTRSAAGQVEIWVYGNPQVNRFATGTIYFDDDDEVSTWTAPVFKMN